MPVDISSTQALPVPADERSLAHVASDVGGTQKAAVEAQVSNAREKLLYRLGAQLLIFGLWQRIWRLM